MTGRVAEKTFPARMWDVAEAGWLGALGVGLWPMMGRWECVGGLLGEENGLDRGAACAGRWKRCVRCLHAVSATLGAWGREGFGSVWGGCGEGGGQEEIWSGVACNLCGGVMMGFRQMGWGSSAGLQRWRGPMRCGSCRAINWTLEAGDKGAWAGSVHSRCW